MLTPEEKADYVKNPNKCPYCRSEENIYVIETIYREDIKRKKTCRCGKRWTDIYTLTAIEEVEEGKAIAFITQAMKQMDKEESEE